MNFCPRCGNALGPTDAFCAACGTPLTGGEYDGGAAANPYDPGAPIAENAGWDGASETTVGPSFWGAFVYCLCNYCNFQGRATRTEYWGWCVVVGLIDFVLNFAALALSGGDDPSPLVGGGSGLIKLLLALPALALMGRRLHDFGWSAKLMFGPIVLFFVGGALFVAGGVLAHPDPTVAIAMINRGLGAGLIVSAAIWQLVLGISAAFVGGTPGPNRFGGKRLNPSKVGR